jgi:hypothetical protein
MPREGWSCIEYVNPTLPESVDLDCNSSLT